MLTNIIDHNDAGRHWGALRWMTCRSAARLLRIVVRERDMISGNNIATNRTSTGDPVVVPSVRSTPISGKKTTSPYESEAQLVRELVEAIRLDTAPLHAVQIGEEFNYNDGRTDVLSITTNGELVAFEAKLTHWRVALHQAYRATSFAHRAYVVMPANVAHRALKHVDEFDRRKVGLCAMQPDGTIAVLRAAPRVDPFMPRVSQRALDFLNAQA